MILKFKVGHELTNDGLLLASKGFEMCFVWAYIVCVRVCVYVTVCLWRAEINVRIDRQLFSVLFWGTGSLTESGTHLLS